MSDKTTEAKQAKQAAASWTAPTSVLYDRVLSPMYDEVARVLWPTWLHPNYITLLGGVFCTLSVLAMQRDAWGWACVLFTLYHACDNTDGKHARRTGKSSKFGHVLDHAVEPSPNPNPNPNANPNPNSAPNPNPNPNPNAYSYQVDATAGVTAITLIFEQVASRSPDPVPVPDPYPYPDPDPDPDPDPGPGPDPDPDPNPNAAPDPAPAPDAGPDPGPRPEQVLFGCVGHSHMHITIISRISPPHISPISRQVLFGCVGHSYMHITMAVFLTCHLAEFNSGG